MPPADSFTQEKAQINTKSPGAELREIWVNFQLCVKPHIADARSKSSLRRGDDERRDLPEPAGSA